MNWDVFGPYSDYYIDNRKIRFVNSHSDLGITIDSSLRFHAHINSTVCKANGLASNLLRSTINRSSSFMIPINKTHIRPLLEFSSSLWFTLYIGDLKKLESPQRRWTKQITGLESLPYSERLKVLDLYSVKGQLICHDLIMCWKIFHNLSVIQPSDMFQLSPLSATRGHRFKVLHQFSSIDCRSRFFSNRIISLWNSLPSAVVELESLNSFKSALHTQLSHVLYDFQD